MLLLSWPGMALLLGESLRAFLRRTPMRCSVVAVSIALLGMSIMGLISISDGVGLTLLTALPFVLGIKSMVELCDAREA